MVNDRIVVPAGTFVQGEITKAKLAAKGERGLPSSNWRETPRK
jgi:hypothetical protein